MATGETRARVIATSVELFLRHGLHRTTLTEIARTAGISRPTLYGLFPDKAHLCAAVIEWFANAKTEEIIRRSANKETLGHKLRASLVACEALVDGGDGCFAKEALASEEPAIVAAIERSIAQREKALTQLIRDSGVDLKPMRLTAPKLARLISASMRGFVQHAGGPAETRDLRNALVRLIEQAVG